MLLTINVISENKRLQVLTIVYKRVQSFNHRISTVAGHIFATSQTIC